MKKIRFYGSLVTALILSCVVSFSQYALVTHAALGDISTVLSGLNSPRGIVFDSKGNYYVSDQANNLVKKVDTSGSVTTYAGTGVSGYSGDGGAATSAQISFPRGLYFDDAAGDLYFADFNNSAIRKVDSGGIITTVAGTGAGGFSGDGGAATSAQLFLPSDVTFDSSGNMYIADQGNRRVRKVDTGGTITTVAGDGTLASTGDGGPATSASIANPARVVFDAAGNMYISEASGHKVRKVDTGGTISTFAGTGTAQGSIDGEGGDPSDDLGDGGPATSASFNLPVGLEIDRYGNLFVTESNAGRVRKITPGGIISTVAGTGTPGFSGDGGPATSAQLSGTSDIGFSPLGDFYVSDQGNNRIRKITNSMSLVSSTPTAEAIDISLSSNITLVFDGTVDGSTVSSTSLPVYSSQQGLVSGGYSLTTTSITDDTVVFNPTDDFFANERVEVIISNGVASTGENPAVPTTLTFRAEATAGTGTYSIAQAFGIPNPGALCFGDFDDDNDNDIAIRSSGNIAIFNNDGTGQFTVSYITALSGLGLICPDVNADGNADLVVGNSGISVLLSNGNGTFASVVTYSGTGGGSGWVSSGDFDSDGDLDVVRARSQASSPGFDIFLNNGDGTYASAVSYDNGLSGVATLAVSAVDVNEDGVLDIASLETDNIPPDLAINLGNGDGTFGGQFVQYALSSGSDARFLIPGDVDGDNHVDLIAIHGSTDFHALLGNGDGTFTVGTAYSVFPGGTCTDGSLSDFDDDGDLDLIAACQDELVSIAENNGSGIFTLMTDVDAALGSYNNGNTEAADLNGDGAVDVVMAAGSQQIVSIAFGDLEAPAVTVVQPNGGESLPVGSMYDIIVKATDNSGTLTTGLEFASNGVVYSPIAGASSLTNDGNTYPFAQTWGTTGSANSQMIDPERVQVDFLGNVYVSDRSNHRIQKFAADGTFLGWIGNCSAGTNCNVGNQVTTAWCTDCTVLGSGQSGDGQLNDPNGMSFMRDESLLVADTGNNRINRYDQDGAFTGCVAGGVNGFQFPCTTITGGSGTSQFDAPYDVSVVLRTSHFMVADTNNDRIQFFNGSSGNFILEFGSTGTGNGQFDAPQGVVIVPDANRVYVSDTNNNRIQYFSGSGAYQGQFGSSGSGNAQFNSPRGISADIDRFVYVADSGNHRIQKFTSGGGFLSEWGSNGAGDGQFDGPHGVVYSNFDVVYVADTTNDRVQQFDPGRSYTWTVPVGTTTLAKIRATSTDGGGASDQDESDAAFSIVGPNSAPAATTPASISQATDGTGTVSFQTTVSDADSDLTRLQVEYSDDGGSTFYDAELLTATPDSGTVDLDNAALYQIGDTDAIDTDGGAVTITVEWNSQSASNGNGPVTGEQSDIRIRVLPNDNTEDGTVQSSGNFTVDNQIPVGLTALSEVNSTATEVELAWTAVTENNFDHYEIWYGANQSDVVNRTGTADEWDGADDPNMNLIATTSTTVTALDEGTSYYFKIFAVDSFGNEETVLEIQLQTASSGGRRRVFIVEPIEGSLLEQESILLEDTSIGSGGTVPVDGLKGAADGQFLQQEAQLTALDTIRALIMLFNWMEEQDYQLLQDPAQLQHQYQIVFQLRDTIAYLGEVLGYGDGYSYRDPDKLEIENVAELLKVFVLKFNSCFGADLTARMLRHDTPENGWWWAGYWHVLGALIQQPYELWDPVDQFDMLPLIERLLSDFCTFSAIET